ncbi:hypothetical protein TNCV_184471 [Trichonephila clavipes]|nr:hypothetical protein TNCV_184471 [Trichonephila clavipes]
MLNDTCTGPWGHCLLFDLREAPTPRLAAIMVKENRHLIDNRRSLSKKNPAALTTNERMGSGTDYMVDALKLLSKAPRDYGELLQKYMFWSCPDGTQHLFCWQILAIFGQYIASNGPVVDSRNLNLVIGHAEVTPNK